MTTFETIIIIHNKQLLFTVNKVTLKERHVDVEALSVGVSEWGNSPDTNRLNRTVAKRM